jgi:LPS-assembly protein
LGLVSFLSFFILHTAVPSAYAAPGGENIQLDADVISFEESTGIATAEGNVRINNGEVRLFAPFVEYDSNGQQVRALSSEEGSVTFVTAGKRLSGERLDYNVAERSGIMTMPNGRVDSFYVRGEAIEVMPSRMASGDVSGNEIEDFDAIWSGASLTTCSDPHPHYRLESKRVSVIAGKRVIIKQPKVFLGDTLVFTYPFDYIIWLDEHDKRKNSPIFPKIGYESDKGAGLGFSGGWGWESGTIDLSVIGWTEDIWEGEAFITQEIWDGLSIYGGVRRSYDDTIDDTKWRPSWGLSYRKAGWSLDAGWRQRELLSVEKNAGYDSKYVLWRKPEVNIVSPWFDDRAAGGWFRLMTTWGRYEDATSGPAPTVERLGAGLQIYGEPSVKGGGLQPFYNAVYWHYRYDGDASEEQSLLDAAVGVRWNLGSFNLTTAYLRRWSWGDSPMAWDDYDDREDIYQEISYSIKTERPDTSWKLGVRGAYSVIDDDLTEMVYSAQYDLSCMLWEAVFRDDLTSDGDDWLGLKLTIKAYPDSGIRLMGNDIFDPLTAPDDLVPKLSR